MVVHANIGKDARVASFEGEERARRNLEVGRGGRGGCAIRDAEERREVVALLVLVVALRRGASGGGGRGRGARRFVGRKGRQRGERGRAGRRVRVHGHTGGGGMAQQKWRMSARIYVGRASARRRDERAAVRTGMGNPKTRALAISFAKLGAVYTCATATADSGEHWVLIGGGGGCCKNGKVAPPIEHEADSATRRAER